MDGAGPASTRPPVRAEPAVWATVYRQGGPMFGDTALVVARPLLEVRSVMTCGLVALCVDANHPLRLARFCAGVLGWEMVDEASDGVALLPNDGTGFHREFFPTQEQKSGQNQMHFDVTSTSIEDQRPMVDRACGLRARHIEVGQRPEERHVVLADTEGNEFCVIELAPPPRPSNAWRSSRATSTSR